MRWQFLRSMAATSRIESFSGWIEVHTSRWERQWIVKWHQLRLLLTRYAMIDVQDNCWKLDWPFWMGAVRLLQSMNGNRLRIEINVWKCIYWRMHFSIYWRMHFIYLFIYSFISALKLKRVKKVNNEWRIHQPHGQMHEFPLMTPC